MLSLIRNYIIGWLENREHLQPVALNFLPKIGEEMFAKAWELAVNAVDVEWCREGDLIDADYILTLGVESDINKHLPTLRLLARQCDHITEMGVRTGVSTRALLAGHPKKLVSYDLNPFPDYFYSKKLFDGEFEFHQNDTRLINIAKTDMLFIDTYHTYEQLGIELMLHAGCVNRYIVLHDTTTFGEVGEDGKDGLTRAINEFLGKEKDWFQIVKLEYNNGLTVLGRRSNNYPPVVD